MENIITILNTGYEEKIVPLLKQNQELKRDCERYRSIALKAVKERDALRQLCKVRGLTE